MADTLALILKEPRPSSTTVPDSFARVITRLMDKSEALNDEAGRPGALAMLNAALAREGFEAFYAEDQQCYLRHIATNMIAAPSPNPHRPFSQAEQERREQLLSYLQSASEDSLIEEVLLPLFRQLGFHRVTAAGHRDKALEYGKDIWMKYTLPTQHVLYFGIQVKKGKLDASGVTRGSNANVAEILNQATMMLGHEVFDPEVGRRVLVDHAFIVAGGEITKAARNWLGNHLDALKRSQIIFMDRDDILNLFVVTNLPLPQGAWGTQSTYPTEPPF
ncbi:restriction endonuclease [Streptomyces sp. INR7]|uniref:restriction endonuclease n=1 Tax=Streptomyces sp. INR7 TaxID=2607753 RepID=UPI0021565844|nr:restriction endonuclease [Streptomyces sp. INR7]